ncbi:MAG: response regulator [Treponema sp.]|nr:response regulator [Treponema sp.]
MKVICVDDEKYVLSDLLETIREIPQIQEATGFRDIGEALEFLKTNSVQIAFLDIDMPEMTGLELCKKIHEISPVTAVVFTTGYPQFALEAFKNHAIGYLLKPVKKEAVLEELENYKNLQKTAFAEDSQKPKFYAKTFGSFDFFVDGVAVKFARSKAKEFLAFLIDRQGSACSRKDIAAVVFEDTSYDRNTQSYMTKILADLKKSLEAAGAPDIIIHSGDTYAADFTKFGCDFIDYLNGKPMNESDQFHGEYMSQYSWAEESIYKFE